MKPTRREILRIGGTGAMGLALPQVLAARESARITPRADACIVLFLNGGPSHLDMWDMKPEGPSEIRGEFQPIATSLPGIQFSEHLPKLARLVDRCTLVRSMHHSVNNSHAAAVYVALTGHDRGEQGGGFKPTDNPNPGAVAALVRPTGERIAPYVALPYKTLEGAAGPPQPGFFGGWLGRSFDPLWILKNPNDQQFSVPEFTLQSDVSVERLASRGALLTALNRRLHEDASAPLSDMNRFQRKASGILTSRTTQSAFRIQEEPSETRDAYGRNIYGQSTLLARRLIEAGTRVVTLSWAPHANATWDTHGNNFKTLKTSLLPQFDLACSALLTDLEDRGMLDRTIVAVLGDFGRTPKINGNNAGRDHWNYCYSLLLAGGGFQRGLVYGASDYQGAFPADRPVMPGDIIATLYRLIGIDHRQELLDRLDRPHRIVPQGAVVQDLIS